MQGFSSTIWQRVCIRALKTPKSKIRSGLPCSNGPMKKSIFTAVEASEDQIINLVRQQVRYSTLGRTVLCIDQQVVSRIIVYYSYIGRLVGPAGISTTHHHTENYCTVLCCTLVQLVLLCITVLRGVVQFAFYWCNRPSITGMQSTQPYRHGTCCFASVTMPPYLILQVYVIILCMHRPRV